MGSSRFSWREEKVIRRVPIVCNGQDHHVEFLANGTFRFPDHKGVHLDDLIAEAEIISSGSGKAVTHCGNTAQLMKSVGGLSSRPPSWNNDVNFLSDFAYTKGLKQGKRKSLQVLPSEEDLFKRVFLSTYKKTGIPKFKVAENEERIVSLITGTSDRFGQVRPVKNTFVEIYVDRKHWGSVHNRGMSIVHMPPSASYALETTLALGEIPSEKGFPILNLVAFRANDSTYGRDRGIPIIMARKALVAFVRNAWHFKDWLV